MRIVIIRHGKVDMQWRRCSTSKEFDSDCAKYDKSPICSVHKKIRRKSTERIYISTLKRSQETAEALLDANEYIRTPLLNEVPLRSSFDTKRHLPLWFWNVTGRMQWMMQSKRQKENKKQTEMRADRAIQMLLEANEDCIIITHGFYMRSLVKCLKKKGFYINKRKLGFSNLEEVIATR